LRLPPLSALLLLGAGCASTASPHGLVRVDLPGPVTGPGSPQEHELAQAVRDAAGAEGLVCQPGSGAALLRCSAGAVGSQSRGITVGLVRSGSGYEVPIDQPIRLPGTTSPVCTIQARVRDRIVAALQAPVAVVDSRSECRGK
jgi:hypothetical protein